MEKYELKQTHVYSYLSYQGSSIAYMAGKLDHYKQNVVICVIVLLKTILASMNFITSITNSGMLSFVNFFSSIGSITVWLAIAGSYIIKYQSHKEAGLKEKK